MTPDPARYPNQAPAHSAAVFDIPTRWEHGGLVLARTSSGAGSRVVGDPCIVRDERVGGWRMVLFCSPPGHAQAVCRSISDVGPGTWEFLGPLTFTNPQDGGDGATHKPYIVQDAWRPNHAARIGGRYMLVSVSYTGTPRHKYVHRAWATDLAGPWTWDAEPLIPAGGPGEFDEKHTDAVSGIYFPEKDECVYFYMGYPRAVQTRAISPFGSAQGVAVERMTERNLRKLGVILPPQQQAGHWASGWVGGLQVVPGKQHRWIALANASPTAPVPDQDDSISREEPPPSLGGWAYCDEPYPVKGWRWSDRPLEWIEDLPPHAIANGEGVNLWRHYLLMLPDGRAAVFYNSGPYGREQLYVKWAAGV